jgi:hypothetical protein
MCDDVKQIASNLLVHKPRYYQKGCSPHGGRSGNKPQVDQILSPKGDAISWISRLHHQDVESSLPCLSCQ